MSSKVIVLKVGTSSLVNPEKQRLNISNLARIIETVKALTCMGKVLPLPLSSPATSDHL